MIDRINRLLLPRRKELLTRLGKATPLHGVLALGVVAGAASLFIYGTDGYSRGMLLIWFVALAALSVYLWSRSPVLPRIARGDLLVGAGLAAVFAPLYLVALFRWPVQVNSDEVAISDVAKTYAHPPANLDPFGLSNYLSRPVLLFLGWGRLGDWIGGIDLYHMRLLHALFGLLTIVASYALFRQLLPRWWAAFAACVFGSSHAFFMISRLAMRENTAVLVEVVALALLLWGLRNTHWLATFWGGVLAGLGFYVYYPARATLPIWIIFLLVLGVISRRAFPVRRLLLLGSIAVAGFVLMATPIVIAESKIPSVPGSDVQPQKETLMIYKDARLKEQQWVNAPTVSEAVKTNIRWGLGAFNNEVIDNGYIYVNPGHGFVDPLTGVLLWVGVALVGIGLIRRRLDEGALLGVTGFLVLWLSFAFVVNKAPNYTRLLVTLPFVAYLVTEAVRWLAVRCRSIRYVPAALVTVSLGALVAWNVAIARDFIQTGREHGDTIGSTGRYVSAHSDVPGQKFFIASPVNGLSYYSFGDAYAYETRLKLFAAADTQVQPLVDPNLLGQFNAQPPFALFMRRELLPATEASLAKRYPLGRFRNITPDGTLLVLEVPPQVQ